MAGNIKETVNRRNGETEKIIVHSNVYKTVHRLRLTGYFFRICINSHSCLFAFVFVGLLNTL